MLTFYDAQDQRDRDADLDLEASGASDAFDLLPPKSTDICYLRGYGMGLAAVKRSLSESSDCARNFATGFKDALLGRCDESAPLVGGYGRGQCAGISTRCEMAIAELDAMTARCAYWLDKSTEPQPF